MLNFNALLEPISLINPAGEDASFSINADAISRARKFDDPTLDQGEWITDIKEADWIFVFKKSQEFLTAESKDLKVVGWLVEAAAKIKQFEGLAAGLELISRLSEVFWDSLHPNGVHGDYEQRAGNIRWILSRSAQLAKEIPLTDGATSQYSWNDFEAARARSFVAAKQGVSVVETAAQPSLTTLESARRKCSKEFYKLLLESIVYCESKVLELEQIMDAKLLDESPSFSALKDALETVNQTVGRYASDAGLKTAGFNVVESGDATNDPISQRPRTAEYLGTVQSREQALDQLRKIAEFFRATEPHSPVAYLAEKAAGWGELPLHSWLRSVVKDPNSLAFLEEMLGVGSGSSIENSHN